MAKPVPSGARAEVTNTVEHQHTLSGFHGDLPPVLSTPWMIAWMEAACYHALQPFAEGDEITVGTAINVSHRTPTTIGGKVTAEAVLERVEGRFHVMRVTARSESGIIGEGTVDRAFVSVSKFMQKMR